MTYIAEVGSASGLAECGGSGGVKFRTGLLVANLARQALNPVEVATGVHNHVERLRRSAERERHDVLATTRLHGTLKLLGPEFSIRAQQLRVVSCTLVTPLHRLGEPLLLGFPDAGGSTVCLQCCLVLVSSQ